jgi:hypothetical protein
MSDLGEFIVLDQLIQLIYIGPSRFVFLTTLESTYKHWDVHLGLSGAEGRWWRGRWTIQDVHQVAVSKSSRTTPELSLRQRLTPSLFYFLGYQAFRRRPRVFCRKAQVLDPSRRPERRRLAVWS